MGGQCKEKNSIDHSLGEISVGNKEKKRLCVHSNGGEQLAWLHNKRAAIQTAVVQG